MSRQGNSGAYGDLIVSQGNKRISLAGLCCFLLVTAGELQAQNRQLRLEQRIESVVEKELLPAYNLGNRHAVFNILFELNKKLDEDALDRVDGMLASAGLPSVSAILVKYRMDMLRQGLSKKLPRPGWKELAATIPEIEEFVRVIQDRVESHRSMKNPLPEPTGMDDYDRLFWEIHVLENQLETASEYCRYGADLTTRNSRLLSKRSSPSEITDTEFEATYQALKRLHSDLQQRKLELRMQRVQLAARQLEASDRFIDRLRAAFVVDLDGEKLNQFFSQLDEHPRDDITRAALRDDELRHRLSERMEHARELAGDLIPQSRLFFEGLHWWLRGRYGRGPEMMGLLKHHDALRDPRLMFGLVMPVEFPAPANEDATAELDSQYAVTPADRYMSRTSIAPDYDRRHYYNWTFEYRTLRQKRDSQTIVRETDHSVTIKSRTVMEDFY